jgi:hypothetical protein
VRYDLKETRLVAGSKLQLMQMVDFVAVVKIRNERKTL